MTGWVADCWLISVCGLISTVWLWIGVWTEYKMVGIMMDEVNNIFFLYFFTVYLVELQKVKFRVIRERERERETVVKRIFLIKL